MLDAFCRLLTLLEQPDEIPALAPLIQQEICYRLLKSEHGMRLQQMVSVGNHGYQIARTIEWMKSNYHESVKVEDLAKKSGAQYIGVSQPLPFNDGHESTAVSEKNAPE